MRWIISLLAALSLACLWVSLSLLNGTGATSTVSVLGFAISGEVLALLLVFIGVIGERLAVALGFFDSYRTGRIRWSLVLVCLCLLVLLNSLFFAMRVRGMLAQRWSILQLPPEEVTPIVEAFLLAPTALAYALCTAGVDLIAARRLSPWRLDASRLSPWRLSPWRHAERPQPEPRPAVAPLPNPLPNSVPSSTPASQGPLTPPLPLPGTL